MTPILAEMGAAGRQTVLVGGTGLYFTALTRGLADIPDVPVEVRDAAGAAFDTEGEAVFRRRLAEVDPAARRRDEIVLQAAEVAGDEGEQEAIAAAAKVALTLKTVEAMLAKKMRQKLEEEARKNPSQRLVPEFGSDKDFQLQQAINQLKGRPVMVSKSQAVRTEEKKEN